MDERATQRSEEMGVDMKRAVAVLWKKAWQIALVSVLLAVAAFLAAKLLVTPKYESSAMFYVNNNAGSGSASSITSSDITASKNLVESYIVILNTNSTMEEIISTSGVSYNQTELSEMISAQAVNSTEIFEVTVTGTDPEEIQRIASAIADILPDRIAGIIDGSSAMVVDYPVKATEPSSPNYIQTAMIGFIFGFVLMVTVILLREIFDVTIRNEEDLERNCDYPILANIPDMTVTGKGTSYGRKSGAPVPRNHSVVGGNASFAATEAYKLLRAKLQFSFADNSNCHVIGVSSALGGEGKSLSAINLAFTLSQLNKKVILLDCDMRKPTLAEKLKIQKTPGLSDFLSGQCKLENTLQDCGILSSETSFCVISAGQNPPNPVELLSSTRMAALLNLLRKNYDYVILDLPPVEEVSDALAVAKETDGVLLVVRQNYCSRPALADTIRQLEFVNAKILGVVMNFTLEGGEKRSGYYKKSRYYGYSFKDKHNSGKYNAGRGSYSAQKRKN